MIRVGLDLGIFEILAKAVSPMSVEEVAKDAGADPELMSSTARQTLLKGAWLTKLPERILRYYNTINVAREVGPHLYEPTNITRNLSEKVCVAAMGH